MISISKYFDVTLDYLMKESDSTTESVSVTGKEETQRKPRNGHEKRLIGVVSCIIGIACLIIWGVVSIFLPSASDRIGDSSMITIDGNGILLIICLVAIISGAVLLLKSSSDK